MDLVSVIVPVYKAEPFLPKCMESLLHQTYGNIEIVLIDDGSPDGCPQLCDRYAAEDPRVKVIHKANGGASSARNAGLDVASGAYICFADSDDALPYDSVADLYNAIKGGNGQCAVGICGIMGSARVKNDITEAACLELAKEPEAVLSFLTRSGSYSPYAKIFDGAIIRENRIRFDTELKCSEDALFIRQYIKHCDKICFCGKRVYEYNMGNPQSLSKRLYPEYSTYFIKKLEALRDIVAILPLEETAGKRFLAWRALHGLYMSTEQYARFEDKAERESLVKRAIAQFRPWFEGFEDTGDEARLSRWYQKCSVVLGYSDNDKAAKKLIAYAQAAGRRVKIKMFAAKMLRH